MHWRVNNLYLIVGFLEIGQQNFFGWTTLFNLKTVDRKVEILAKFQLLSEKGYFPLFYLNYQNGPTFFAKLKNFLLS
jgi:hypothetical protein